MNEQVHCPVCDIPITRLAYPHKMGEQSLQLTVKHGDWELVVSLVDKEKWLDILYII